MRVVATAETLDHVNERGGTVYLRTHPVRCCGGRGWTLEASTDAPEERVELLHETDGVRVFAPRGFLRPDELHLEVGRRGRLHAYWDNQAWIG